MNLYRNLLAGLTALLLLGACTDPDVRAARELASRVLGERAGQVRFEKIDTPSETDFYEVEGAEGAVVIRGNDAGAMAVGLNQIPEKRLPRLCVMVCP